MDVLKKHGGGGKLVGNITLRGALGWQPEKYSRVRDGWLETGRVISGRGQGGSVRLKPRLVKSAKPVIVAPPAQHPTSIRLFISYSHSDEKLKLELEKHLSLLKRQGLLETWHDGKIMPGDDWDKSISLHLERAHIILLLVSAAFLASSYCDEREIQRAIERNSRGEARVIPVILGHCLWKRSQFSNLQSLPTHGKPVISWIDQDEAFLEIAEGVAQVAIEILGAKTGSTSA